MHHDLRQAVRRVLPAVRSDLEALVRIPSISADAGSLDAVRRSAEITALLFRNTGSPQVDILDDIEGGRPAVLVRYAAPPGQPTALLYAHHDVQPAGDPTKWSSPPFQPTEREGRLYGRGTADDKAGIAAHLAALRAHSGRPPIGVTVLVEGEEEIGSPNLGTFLTRHRDTLDADVVVLADADNLTSGTPCLTTGLRGIASCTVELRALERGVHSGIYGGAAPDALTALCRLLATLHDEQGNVTVEGLATATALAGGPSEAGFRAEAGLLDGVHLLGSGSIAQRLWSRPAATVLAIDATPVDAASNTLAPMARAKVGLRLAPGDDAVAARQALARHLRHHTPWGLHVTVTEGEAGQPFAVDARGPAFDAARRAYGRAYGSDVVDIGSGASIPFIAAFAHAYPDAAILIASAGADGDSRTHSVNESLHLADFEHACLAEALLLAELRQ
ncbi:M20/M25/M40 family metallo-hydrolase [Streptomyces sp. NPDC057555]|uniref:M20/M25/M40 family metallo-hydrolase n=1 Tax=Streptomyces sp. NPDC057555 TaxID=3346166 RepID=UPI0036C08FE5